jgi:hypothetical protein
MFIENMARGSHTTPAGSHNIGNNGLLQICDPFGVEGFIRGYGIYKHMIPSGSVENQKHSRINRNGY